MQFPTLKTDFTVNDYYSAQDLNRVGNAVNYLSNILRSYGYDIKANSKTDWSINDEIKISEMNQYIKNVKEIKNKYYGQTDLPETMKNIDYEDANNIERLLLECEDRIKRMLSFLLFSGELYCGEV